MFEIVIVVLLLLSPLIFGAMAVELYVRSREYHPRNCNPPTMRRNP